MEYRPRTEVHMGVFRSASSVDKTFISGGNNAIGLRSAGLFMGLNGLGIKTSSDIFQGSGKTTAPYIAGRSLQEALHRVIAHCAQVRALVASQAINIHGRRAGKSSQPLCGSMQFFLDKAYDRLPRRDLEASLRAAQSPKNSCRLA